MDRSAPFRSSLLPATGVMLAALASSAFALAAPQGPGRGEPAALTAFEEVAGVREFTGRLIARPWQPEVLAARGLDAREIAEQSERVRAVMANFTMREYVPQTDEYVFRVPEGQGEQGVSEALMAEGLFQYVDPDWLVYPVGCPNDSQFASQWHHAANIFRSCDAWDLGTGDPSVSVGICDTGIRTTHEDFQLHRLEGYNAVDRLWESQGGRITPVHPHGTMTTGCAAANGNNGVGIAGMGWDLSHRMLRVSNSSSGSASLTDLNHAARTSIENGDKVASVSYSGVDSNTNLTTASYVRSLGGLLVWAAGNEGRNLGFGPRDADDLLVVGATDAADKSASFSNFGIFVDVVAPGVSVFTTDSASDTAYAFVSGTSFSTPLTAGLCALLCSFDPSLSADQIESLVKVTAVDLGSAGIDNTFGYGRISSYAALTECRASVSKRNAGSNPDVFTATLPKLGSTLDLSVNGTGLGFGATLLVIHAAPAQVDMGGGRFALVDLGSTQYFRQVAAGASHVYSLGLPDLPALCGLPAYAQTVLFNSSTDFVLSNSQDLLLGY